jgi:hypothetical protein
MLPEYCLAGTLANKLSAWPGRCPMVFSLARAPGTIISLSQAHGMGGPAIAWETNPACHCKEEWASNFLCIHGKNNFLPGSGQVPNTSAPCIAWPGKFSEFLRPMRGSVFSEAPTSGLKPN